MTTVSYRESITFQKERAQDCFTEAKPLMERNWEEISAEPGITLDPDFEVYRTAEDAGMVRAFSVRRGGEMVGYAVFFVARNPHCRGSVQAVQDVLYMAPEARQAMDGINFIRFCDKQLAAEGIQVVRQYVTKRRDFGSALRVLGYEEVATVYSKRLDGG